MILPVNSSNSKINYTANKDKEKKLAYNHDTLLDNNLKNRTKIGIDKLTNALTVYPAKGLKGSKNANFYEFLTMGTVPYLIGSGMLMAVFNYAGKHYSAFQRYMSKLTGNKLALGVLFYGIMKSVSKSFVSTPIKMMTGVDIEQPYAKVIYELPDDINDTDIMSIEHHKVFESVEFPRWDLLYQDKKGSNNRNLKYDKIAQKMGLGKNLNDSDQEVKPRIKEMVVKASLAKSISSYLWAAAGVALAVQKPWDNFFEVMNFNPINWKEFKKTVQSFGNNFVESAKTLYKGEGQGIAKLSGKILISAAALSTVFGVINALHTGKSYTSPSDVINKNDRYIQD